MRLKGYRRLNPFSWQRRTVKRALMAFYVIALPVYLYIGFQPANATISTSGVATPSAIGVSGVATLSATTTYSTAATTSSTLPDATTSATSPDATSTTASATLAIPSIGLSTPVQPLQLTTEHTLETPDYIAGSYAPYANKTLLIGHSSTVFSQLADVRIGNDIIYNNKTYHVIRREIATKESIDMRRLIKTEKDDLLVLMTCAGQPLGNRDATHRLLVTAIEQKLSP